MTRKYDVLFFDLDHTLWDFDANSHSSMQVVYDEFGLQAYTRKFERWYKVYSRENSRLWRLFREHKVDKTTVRNDRFARSLRNVGAPTEPAVAMADRYLDLLAQQEALLPGALELLAKLQPHYTLAIITNGFAEVQQRKMDASGLSPYFSQLITSDAVGVLKPHPRIFAYALEQLGTTPERCLMIGDDLISDIRGAERAGIDAVWLSAKGDEGPKVPLMIRQLDQLCSIAGLC